MVRAFLGGYSWDFNFQNEMYNYNRSENDKEDCGYGEKAEERTEGRSREASLSATRTGNGICFNLCLFMLVVYVCRCRLPVVPIGLF